MKIRKSITLLGRKTPMILQRYVSLKVVQLQRNEVTFHIKLNSISCVAGMSTESWLNLSAGGDASSSLEAATNDTGHNASSGYQPFYERPETYIVPILFAIIFIVGVLGNGTLVLIFGRHRRMRNVPNTYIFSLALGDLLLILTCVPFTSTVYTIESWPYGEFICKLSEFVKDLSIGVSVFTLTALSADRYSRYSVFLPLFTTYF